MGTVGRPGDLPGQVPGDPPVDRRPVHSQTGSYLRHPGAVQDRADRVQALLDNRQDNQCQSRPPRRDVPRKRRTRVAETGPLSQINWRKNVARQSTEDKCLGPAAVTTFYTVSRARPDGRADANALWPEWE